MGTYTFTDFSAAIVDGANTLTIAGNGTASFSDDGSTVVLDDEIYLYQDAQGSFADPDVWNGEWYRDTTLTADNSGGLGSMRYQGYIYTVWTDGGTPTGDLCFDLDQVESATCPSEPDGTVSLQGTGLAEVVLDGSTTCDDCGEASIDGVSIGTLCP